MRPIVTAGLLTGLFAASLVFAQSPEKKNEPATSDEAQLTNSVSVKPTAEDEDISARLGKIMNATGWFESVSIRVDSGVVFLDGVTEDEARKDWAGSLANNTVDVVAVVNNIQVVEASQWSFEPAVNEVKRLAAKAYQLLPLLLLAGLILVATWIVAAFVLRSIKRLLLPRMGSKLLSDVVARTIATLVFILGFYIVMQVSGLTGLAATIVGGTGIIGLALGFAFKDIAGNFLASVLISIQRPFAMGDLIEVAGHEGFVQRVNARVTTIMTRDGNHVQIPNGTIYKNTITNFTANPKARASFAVGIGYDDSIGTAQSIAVSVLRKHSAILDDPEPIVLVEGLGAATVNLRAYFWVDIETYNLLKVRSAVIRLTKVAFDESGISMPDEAREVVFPNGVPVTMQEAEMPDARHKPDEKASPADSDSANEAEGGLLSDADEIEKQAREARLPEEGKDLLRD
jgi:small-conductance mechanosensitive channel